jgi:hypothetical protein
VSLITHDARWLHFWWRSPLIGGGRRRPRKPCDLHIVLQRSLPAGVSRTLKASVPREGPRVPISASAAMARNNMHLHDYKQACDRRPNLCMRRAQ